MFSGSPFGPLLCLGNRSPAVLIDSYGKLVNFEGQRRRHKDSKRIRCGYIAEWLPHGTGYPRVVFEPHCVRPVILVPGTLQIFCSPIRESLSRWGFYLLGIFFFAWLELPVSPVIQLSGLLDMDVESLHLVRSKYPMHLLLVTPLLM